MRSGLSALPKGVSPDEVKLVGTPAQVVGTSVIWRVKRTVTAPPLVAAAARSRAPSRSEMTPPAIEKIPNVGSPGRFSAITIPVAPAALARAAFASYGQPPRLTRAIAPRRDPAGSVPSQSWRLAPATVPTSTSRWFAEIHDGGMLSEGENGIGPTPPGATTVIAGPKTCAFATAPTLIASGAVAGEPAVPSPKKSRSLPAEMTGTTPARTMFVTAGMRTSVRGSACGPPPEKLMMSIPSRTAASNAATISGLFAEQQPPSGAGAGTLKTR